MKAPRVMIAATKSGSGKTMITCGLLKAWKERGILVSAFKTGPDYIDPMFHKKVIGIPSQNLDTFFSPEDQITDLFMAGRQEQDISVLEGVMGLYDGCGGIKLQGSSYDLARALQTPIILVVDVHGMGRSMIPLIQGFLSYDQDHLIRGVILNRMSPMLFQTMKPLLEEELSVPVIGYLPGMKDLQIESRYLGLKLPEEVEELQDRLKKLACAIEETVSLDQIVAIAKDTKDLEPGNKNVAAQTNRMQQKKVRIGVARDEAFCFYYEANINLLSQYGAELLYFSPLHDQKLPENLDGLLLGGGYPELFAKELSENHQMKQAIQQAIFSGMPSVAECGGFLYLHETLEDLEQNVWDMCGVIPATCFQTKKLNRFGYVTIHESHENFLPMGEEIRGHEFHYFDSADNGSDCIATKPVTNRSWNCMMDEGSHCWGFPHLYYPSNPEFVNRFLQKAYFYRHSDKNSLTSGKRNVKIVIG